MAAKKVTKKKRVVTERKKRVQSLQVMCIWCGRISEMPLDRERQRELSRQHIETCSASPIYQMASEIVQLRKLIRDAKCLLNSRHDSQTNPRTSGQ